MGGTLATTTPTHMFTMDVRRESPNQKLSAMPMPIITIIHMVTCQQLTPVTTTLIHMLCMVARKGQPTPTQYLRLTLMLFITTTLMDTGQQDTQDIITLIHMSTMDGSN